MGDLTGGIIVQGGAAGILAGTVVLILMGRLVPRSVLEDVRADRDARVAEIAAERDSWRAAHDRSEEGRRLASDQVDELLEVARTVDHLIHALPQPKPPAGEEVNRAVGPGVAS